MSKNKYSLAQVNAIYCVYKDLNPNTHTTSCVTCGKSIHIDSFEQCFSLYGHYIARSLEPKLKYHPLNTHCQCANCNMYETPTVKKAYDDYMVFRYGENIKNKLLAEEPKTEQEYEQFYLNELVKLSTKFPELIEVICDSETGEVYNFEDKLDNNIEQQFKTFSVTYKQDLDELARALGTQPIEYERY